MDLGIEIEAGIAIVFGTVPGKVLGGPESKGPPGVGGDRGLEALVPP